MVEPSTGDGGHAVEAGYVIAARMSVSKLKQTRLDKGAPGREGGREGTYAAKRPVSKFPTRPPTACSAKMSNASSTFKKNLSCVA